MGGESRARRRLGCGDHRHVGQCDRFGRVGVGEDPLPFNFGFDPKTLESASLTVDGASAVSDVSCLIDHPVSAVVIGAYADSNKGAYATTDFAVRLLSGEPLYSSALTGDGDGHFFVFEDLRLANGFTVEGYVDLDHSAETETTNVLWDPQA